ncbi:hypothetical protein U9M48_030177 [Paspalum notatum var. saurae]|uniref:Uncharacterized protein n=1 Tax=Paspalum notatum var. saurae TaxID=547442 RepID=A0AAQ3TZK7_PASNO
MADGRRRGRSDGDGSGSGRSRAGAASRGRFWTSSTVDALPLEDMPALGPRLLGSGVCFGFADPVTNIIANTISGGGHEVKKRKRRYTTGARAREEVLSEIVADGAVAKRSLVGLVTFLTSYFRHLETSDALCYLWVARADLLVAVRRIQDDHCYHRKEEKFSICSHAVQAALKCAALSARQPNIDAFLTGSNSLLHVISETTALPERPDLLSVRDILRLSGLLRRKQPPLEVNNPVDLAAAARTPHYDGDAGIEKGLTGLTDSLRALLMDAIHRKYLKALSRMPPLELRRCHYRGLLKAGYCLGPFDPVSNIIINTIWYDTTFTAPEELEVVDMITTSHVESRSLDVLIKLLQECIPDVSQHDAMVYLLKSNIRFRKAVGIATQEGHHNTSSWTANVYKAAAVAAYHPQPEALMVFVMQTLPIVRSAVNKLLKSSRILSSREINDLSRLLSPSNPPITFHPTDELSKEALEMISKYKENFMNKQAFVREKVQAALHKYEQTKGHQYELHVICGWNQEVGMENPVRHWERPYYYSHVNFWASPKDGTNPILFFAEFSNHEDNESHQSFCCPLFDLSTHVRCCYCEKQRARVVHPVGHYCGGEQDFELMACEREEDHLTNDDIVGYGNIMDMHIGIFSDDIIFLDPTRDSMLIQRANGTAYVMNLDFETAFWRAQDMLAHRGATDFGFCYGDLAFNETCPIGHVKAQNPNECIVNAVASSVEISHRIMMTILDGPLDKNGPFIDIQDLLRKFRKKMGEAVIEDKDVVRIDYLFDMLHIIAADGVKTKDSRDMLLRISGRSFIAEGDFLAASSALADGYPLIVGFQAGKKLASLKPGVLHCSGHSTFAQVVALKAHIRSGAANLYGSLAAAPLPDDCPRSGRDVCCLHQGSLPDGAACPSLSSSTDLWLWGKFRFLRFAHTVNRRPSHAPDTPASLAHAHARAASCTDTPSAPRNPMRWPTPRAPPVPTALARPRAASFPLCSADPAGAPPPSSPAASWPPGRGERAAEEAIRCRGRPSAPMSEVSEQLESPSPYGDMPTVDAGVGTREREGVGAGEEEVEEDEVEVEALLAAVSFWRLFEFTDGVDWALMATGAERED